jgi:hypothetical protein
MKAIADTLYAWFLIRKIVDAKILLCENIRLISPSRKNTLFIPKPVKISKSKKKKDLLSNDLLSNDNKITEEKPKKLTYQEGKKLSIEFCQNIITPEWLDYFKGFSKKDDLADCLLQGYSFFTLLIDENNKKIRKEVNNKIKEDNNKIKEDKKQKKVKIKM